MSRSTDGGRSFSDPPVPAAQLEDGFSDTPWSVIGSTTVWGHQIRWTAAGNVTVNPANPNDVTVVWSDRGTPNPNASPGLLRRRAGRSARLRPVQRGAELEPQRLLQPVQRRRGDVDGPAGLRRRRRAISGSRGPISAAHGTLVVAWDDDDQPAGGAMPVSDTFHHVLSASRGVRQAPIGPAEHIDESVTHWAGQYVAEDAWPAVCGPVGYPAPPPEGPGRICNQFHGDYTGLAVDSLNRAHVVWTGLNRFVTSTQIDPYTGALHDGYAQDAMYARR